MKLENVTIQLEDVTNKLIVNIKQIDKIDICARDKLHNACNDLLIISTKLTSNNSNTTNWLVRIHHRLDLMCKVNYLF